MQWLTIIISKQRLRDSSLTFGMTGLFWDLKRGVEGKAGNASFPFHTPAVTT